MSGGINGRPHPKGGQWTNPGVFSTPSPGFEGHPPPGGAGGRGTGCPPKLILAAGVIYGLNELLTASGWSA